MCLTYIVVPMHRRHGQGHHPGGRGAPFVRCRWWVDDPPGWAVRSRVERFVEPALLLVLRDAGSHGYDLADAVEALTGEPVDLGNLYRLLRALEEEGVVSSLWRRDLPGRSKRTYELTTTGGELLAAWVAALKGTRETIDELLARYEGKRPTEEGNR